MLIWLLCGAVVFVVAILGNLIVSSTWANCCWCTSSHFLLQQCPKEYVYSPAELSGASLNSDPDHMLVAIRGEAFDLTKFATLHQPGSSVIPLVSVLFIERMIFFRLTLPSLSAYHPEIRWNRRE